MNINAFFCESPLEAVAAFFRAVDCLHRKWQVASLPLAAAASLPLLPFAGSYRATALLAQRALRRAETTSLWERGLWGRLWTAPSACLALSPSRCALALAAATGCVQSTWRLRACACARAAQGRFAPTAPSSWPAHPQIAGGHRVTAASARRRIYMPVPVENFSARIAWSSVSSVPS